jgi:hypothetical protein
VPEHEPPPPRDFPRHHEKRDTALVRTLAAAHAETKARQPGPDDGLLEWVAHHQRAAELYEAVSRTDAVHSAEAAAWARIERREAETLQANLADLIDAYLR